jgi:predicted chitinase/LysM repeat protein
MSENLREVLVEPNDTLWKIANRNRVTVKELADANPQIRDLDKLEIRQRIKIPGTSIGFTLRFVNLINQAPVGIRYRILSGKQILVTGRVSKSDNETSFGVRDGEVLTLMAQRIGEKALAPVAHIPVRRKHPVMIVRINSAKIPSKTEPHPKSPLAPAKQAPAAPTKPPPPPAKKIDQGVPNTPGANKKAEPEHLIVPGDCACGVDLTIEQLVATFPSRTKAQLEKFVPHLNAMFKSYAIDSCLRKSHALAQMGHESGGLHYMAELVSNAVAEANYGGYKGRGLIQITFEENYKKYGDYVGVDFLGANKVKLEEIKYATDSAGWFWCHGKGVDLNTYADKNDLLQISAKINGAFNGLDDRINIFKRAHKALNAPACKTEKNRSTAYLSFEESAIYDNAGSTFGWAYWHDPDTSRHGTPKSAAIAKKAYQRFLVLHAAHPSKKRFGLTVAGMVARATEKSQ